MSKYHAVKTICDGIVFDSKREARRWSELKLLQKARLISDLERQVKYDISVNDTFICSYRADFTYTVGKAFVCEDSKGAKTRAYILKRKLMKAVHGITIRET